MTGNKVANTAGQGQKKLLLVYPRNDVATYSGIGDAVRSATKKQVLLMDASLATVAAMTPPEFQITIINENIEPINFEEKWDLVGITSFINSFQRAKEIAAELKKRGALIVCGGPSVSLSPERWRSVADVLIIGEAERIWPRFVQDYLEGSYNTEYRETKRLDLSISPIPDYSGYSKTSLKRFMGGIVQTSRGCPFDCDFCDVGTYMGHKMRYKPIENILQEVEQLYESGQIRGIFLADDNFPANRQKAKEILRALREFNGKHRRKLTFHTQLSIDASKDEEFLQLSSEAGLTSGCIGIETPNVNSLKECRKYQNIDTDMLEAIKIFNQYGVLIQGGCMVGFDSDDLSIFQWQFDFFMQTGIPIVLVFPVQAADGSRLKERMIEEGRYINWEETYNTNPKIKNVTPLNTLTVIPKQMTIEQLKQGIHWLLHKLYSPENFLHRFGLFFENFESSPKKDGLKIPKNTIDTNGLKIAGRVLRYLLFKSTPAERSIFWKMFGHAKRSSHPQRFEMLIANFLRLLNMHEILLQENPDIEKVRYPI